MRTVTLLIATYFCGAPASRWMTLLGFLMTVVGTAGVLLQPLMSSAAATDASMALSAILWACPTSGILMLLFGGSLMPLMLGRFALSRQLCMLPAAGLKIVASALATIALLAVISSLMVVALYAPYPIDHKLIFLRALVISALVCSLVYMIVWLVSRARSAIGLLGGAMLMIAGLALPLRFILTPSASLRWPVIGNVFVSGALVVIFLFARRIAYLFSSANQIFVRRAPARYTGREVDLFVGTARPWMFSAGQLFPIAVATQFISSPAIWLFYFAIFSVISGAMTSLAAARCRNLWLRTEWSRAELFRHVESCFCRHNAYSLGVLLLSFIAFRSYMGFEARLLAFGLPLLALGTATSTYLGLMMTRNICWQDAALATVIVLLIMVAAISVKLLIVVGVEVLLAGSIPVLRWIAERRWAQLDWAVCRSELSTKLR